MDNSTSHSNTKKQRDASDCGWLLFIENIGEFNKRIQTDKDCLVKFDNGVICRYREEHPLVCLTHFK